MAAGGTAGGAVTDAEVLARVYEIVGVRHYESIAYRRHAPQHIMTAGHRRYWDERLAIESLRDVTTLAEMLASKHALVREATLLALDKR